ncbi:hypothetical protein B9Z65_807 [Elsinoe australis]|uniref:G-protein coupled receptors family 2 profile 2 domain-containing protein n=1 Tax=Elsinoe australis TaxID=40998 RepID=A0A2P8AJM8_9PEZI|nr:hypothetical protein B9Z65_807 [Elsinoe australis]
MSLNTTLLGGCPPPFYNAASFPSSGGFTDARVCLPPERVMGLTCCLPCPTTQWVYPESFEKVADGAAWVNVFSLCLLVFVLVSYALLPAQFTRSHYLNTCLVISACMINLGFIVPHAADSNECANPITPNDMYSSTSCAFSGAFILAGGLTAVMWVFVRALSMHLQICWDISPGRRFFYWTQLLGWALPAAVFTAAITATGVSFRFGPGACHINHDHSMADFWGWLLAVAGIAIFVQFGTMFYCFHVYLRNIWADDDVDTQATESQNAPTYNSSQRAQTARAIYNRLKRVLWLQWRGLALVTSMLIDVVFFAVTFVLLDSSTTKNESNAQRAAPWLTCLAQHPTSPGNCFALGQKYLVNQSTISAVILLLSIIGPLLFVLTFRFSFLTGWKQWLKSRFISKQEFVSLDAAHQSGQAGYGHQNAKGTMFEMQQPHKEYSMDVDQTTGSPSLSTIGTPTEKINPAMQYSYSHSRRGTNPSQTSSDQGYFNAASPPRSPQQTFVHPNPNVARAQNTSSSPTFAQYSPPAGYVQPAPVQPAQYTYQHQPQNPYPVGSPYDQPGAASHSGYGMPEPQLHHQTSVHQQPSHTPPPQVQARSNYVPEYAHQNYQSQPQEMQQPGQSVGLAMRYDDSQPGHVVYR